MFAKRTVTMMGDGGFWHNGLTSGIANAVFNKNDGILVIMKNGYSSATGTQELPSSPQHSDTHAPDMSMERALAGIGVDWVQTVDNYRVGEVAKTLKEAMTTRLQGPQGHHRRRRVPARAPAQAAARCCEKSF